MSNEAFHFLLCGRLFVTLHPLNRIVITSIYGKRLLLCFILLFSFLIQMIAQIRGVVKDADTGEPISYLNVFYVEKAVGAITYMDERFEIQRVIEWKERTFSSIGYEAIIVPISAKTKDLAVFMKPFYRKSLESEKKYCQGCQFYGCE